jgi:hypothetical protein
LAGPRPVRRTRCGGPALTQVPAAPLRRTATAHPPSRRERRRPHQAGSAPAPWRSRDTAAGVPATQSTAPRVSAGPRPAIGDRRVWIRRGGRRRSAHAASGVVHRARYRPAETAPPPGPICDGLVLLALQIEVAELDILERADRAEARRQETYFCLRLDVVRLMQTVSCPLCRPTWTRTLAWSTCRWATSRPPMRRHAQRGSRASFVLRGRDGVGQRPGALGFPDRAPRPAGLRGFRATGATRPHRTCRLCPRLCKPPSRATCSCWTGAPARPSILRPPSPSRSVRPAVTARPAGWRWHCPSHHPTCANATCRAPRCSSRCCNASRFTNCATKGASRRLRSAARRSIPATGNLGVVNRGSSAQVASTL